MVYLVPEYYKNFMCKCEACRHSCCEGWPVNISLQEYYRLLGLDCSDDLRRKLDCALKIRPYPSSDCYAQISSDWQGKCMLHREDGLCALQSELGESGLVEVCRLYPRSTRQLADFNISCCSCSCEAVVELLRNMKSPLLFEEITSPASPKFAQTISHNEYTLCKESILLIQNRSLSLSQRLLRLGSVLNVIDASYPKPDQLSQAFFYLFQLEELYGNNISIGDFISSAQGYYGIEDKESLTEDDLRQIYERHLSASEHLKNVLPDLELLMEQLLVNHMFHNSFPFYENHEKTEDAYLSLVITYAFLRFHILSYMISHNSEEHPVDYFAAMFRLIEHSDFRQRSVSLFMHGDHPLQETIYQLLNI